MTLDEAKEILSRLKPFEGKRKITSMDVTFEVFSIVPSHRLFNSQDIISGNYIL